MLLPEKLFSLNVQLHSIYEFHIHFSIPLSASICSMQPADELDLFD